MKKKQILLLFSSILVLSLMLSGCTPKSEDQPIEKTENQQQVEDTFYVKSEVVSLQAFDNELTLPGKAEPVQTVVVTAKTAGAVKSAPYDIGDTVEKDTVLLTLDDQDHKIAASTAKLGLEKASIQLKTAKDDLAKNRTLYDSGAISKSTLDNYENGYKQASIGYKTSKNSYETAAINLDNTTIESPIAGIISSKNFAIGENINPGTPVYTVVNTEQMNVIIGIPEQYISGVATNQEVTLTTQYGRDTWTGKVMNISPVMDDRNYTYKAKILVENPNGTLKAGMSLDVTVTMSNQMDKPAFNKLGLILEEERTYVYVHEDNRAVMKAVTIGQSNDDYYEVLDGLNMDEEVITEGSAMLEDGNLIEIKN